jgi:hypothetical protein
MMRQSSAVKICSHWHGGQWSALYQFASSGIYTIENHLRYLQEIEQALHPEYNLYPGELSKKDEGNLTGLKWFFIRMGERNNIGTEYHQHEVYGYQIPYITEETADTIADKVNVISYMK